MRDLHLRASIPGLTALVMGLTACSACGGGHDARANPATAQVSSTRVASTRSPSNPARPSTGTPAALGSDGALPPRPPGAVRTWSSMGTNLDVPEDWSETIPFIDQFRLSRTWSSSRGMGRPDDDRPIDVDAHGWVRSLAPDQIVRSGMLWDVEHARAGRYVVLYEGRGRMIPFGGAHDRRVEAESRPGRWVIDFDPERDGTGLGLAILATDPADPIRNIRVIEPGGACERDRARFCDETRPCGDQGACLGFEEHHEELVFDPDFLATLGSYRAIRFMNWQATNNSEDRRWADRPQVDDARWSDHGVPFEVILDLTNRLGVEPWLCVPHRATDDYARRMGALVQARLDPSLRVRVELSNEVWNGIFTQWAYARDEGLRLRLVDDPTDASRAQIRWVAHRSGEVFEAFDAGFGAEAGPRVVHVLATHAANPWVAEQMLEWRDTARHVDELSIAPYFGRLLGPDTRIEALAGGPAALLSVAESDALPEAFRFIRAHAAIARAHDLDLTAYEAGQHFVAVNGMENDEEIAALVMAVNRDPQMGALYARYLDGWRREGGGLMMHFVHAGGWGRHGAWGALEHPRQPIADSPKAMVLERFARTTPPWW